MATKNSRKLSTQQIAAFKAWDTIRRNKRAAARAKKLAAQKRAARRAAR
ncbi:MAG: hypothetical protein HUU21_09460 [Polyangiaceae bacterium]|nr:hypothetical protein [Polyangiaceae bacterium]